MSTISISIPATLLGVPVEQSVAALAMDIYDTHGLEAFQLAFLLTGGQITAEELLERVFVGQVTSLEFASKATRHGYRAALLMAVFKEHRLNG